MTVEGRNDLSADQNRQAAELIPALLNGGQGITNRYP